MGVGSRDSREKARDWHFLALFALFWHFSCWDQKSVKGKVIALVGLYHFALYTFFGPSTKSAKKGQKVPKNANLELFLEIFG